MKIRVPYLVQDPALSASKLADKPVEFRPFDGEAFCLAGPITRRVAVLDFDPETGALSPGVPFVAATEAKPGFYDLDDDKDHLAADFLPVNVFSTVLATLYMFEEEDALGREIEWAFGSSQLLVVPRAGELANAFYQRESRSLQFFYFPAQPGSITTGNVFAGLSQDIIAHETAHAILDGVAPDLYHSLTPQSLAIHEAVADLTSLLSALRSRSLRKNLLEETGGNIGGQTALARIAEQFGFERDHSGRSESLRSLWNRRTLDPNDNSLDELNRRNFASRAEPHLLSQVLAGALYRVFVHLHEEYKARFVESKGGTPFSQSGLALFSATEHFKRLTLRSLDYLPPGEVSFADYGRAILASDKASYQDHSEGRAKLVELFTKRHIVGSAAELDTPTNQSIDAITELDLETFVASDWAAYAFVNEHRSLFAVPEAVNFRVYPRLKATKVYQTENGREPVTECVVKVSWDRLEDNPKGFPIPALRQITVGTTMVIDWETQVVRALLISDAAQLDVAELSGGTATASAQQQQDDRDVMLKSLVEEGRVAVAGESLENDGPDTGARIEVSGNTMRIRATAQMLHVSTSADSEPAGAGDAGDDAVAPLPLPPPGVDAGVFYDLVERRTSGKSSRVLHVDAPSSFSATQTPTPPTPLINPPIQDGENPMASTDDIPTKIAPVEPPELFDAPRPGLALAEVDRLIRANEARNLFGVTGDGLTVAVCDTGLNDQHVDFFGRVPAQQNFTADNGGNSDNANDGNGHGTNVGGIIVADGDHRGVAPGASIIPLKVLGDNGSGDFASVVDALDWVIANHAEHNISAVCMSLGAGDNRQTDDAAAGHDINDRIGQLRDLCIPVAIAAGNDFFPHNSEQGMSFPGILRTCVSVGAVYDANEGGFNYSSGAIANSSGPDRITPFSQRLHEDVGGECQTDIFAPGAPVTSSGIGGPRAESVQQGTSQATPVTVGVMMLMQDLHRRLSGELPEVDALVAAMRDGAVSINDGDDEDDNVVNTNLDFHRLDAMGALGAIVRGLQQPV